MRRSESMRRAKARLWRRIPTLPARMALARIQQSNPRPSISSHFLSLRYFLPLLSLSSTLSHWRSSVFRVSIS